MRTTSQDTIHSRFYTPLELALQKVTARHCPGFSDQEFIESGIGRALAMVNSGRHWVQQLRMWMNNRLSVSNFFDSLKSKRRLDYLQQVAIEVYRQLNDINRSCDPLAAHPELDDFAVFASDGHFEKAPTHHRGRDDKGVCAFYSLNLRTHGMRLLDIARPKRKREHDITALKRIGAKDLRMGEPQGVKVLHIYDPAVIDYAQWSAWKARGIYIISLEKANSTAMVIGLNDWDADDPRNLGVLNDELVGVFCGVMLRRVRYRDAVSGKIFTFMTTELNLPPGIIAFLYKLRWDVEKVFDEKKNKLHEQKAWATSEVARCQQCHFICLAHNLMVLFEHQLADEHGVTDVKNQQKRARRLKQVVETLRERGETPNPLVMQCVRITQRRLQFIRWLRHCLDHKTPYDEGVELLKPYMLKYIS